MADPQRKHDYTYADYLRWESGDRFELIHGIPYAMSPAPRVSHQAAVFAIAKAFDSLLDDAAGRACRVIVSPVDVRLFQQPGMVDEGTDTVVQPDVVVVCDPEQIDEKGILGPPTVVVEVLSESTSYRDQSEKLSLYERAGVGEYWVVNGDGGWIMVYRREDDTPQADTDSAGRFRKPDYYTAEDTARTIVAPTGRIQPARIFEAMKLPKKSP